MLVDEFHLGLRRVDVDVDACRIHLQAYEVAGKAALRQHVVVGLFHRRAQGRMLDETAVDEEVLLAARLARIFGLAHEPLYLQQVGLFLHIEKALLVGVAVEACYALQHAARLEVVEHLAVARQAEAYVIVYQRHAAEHLLDVAQLHAVLFQEVSSCRHVEEEVLHRYRGARRAGCGLLAHNLRPLYDYLRAQLAVVHAGAQLHLCDGGYRGQGLAAEAHGVDGEEVVGAVYLARGVALEAQACVAVAHAAAVVDHLDERAPRVLEDEVDLRGAGIHGVLQQLLDGAGGAVHHLAGRYLVGHAVGQYVDYIHCSILDFKIPNSQFLIPDYSHSSSRSRQGIPSGS